MTNRFGTALDRNGYAPSIVQTNTRVCWLDGLGGGKLDRHKIFGGPFRKKSKALGLWVCLHHRMCHLDGPEAVHCNADTMLRLKQAGQRAAMQTYGWTVEDFRREFGKNYLNLEDMDA